MAKRNPLFLLVPLMLFVSVSAQDAPIALPPMPDSLKIDAIPLNTFQNADSAEIRPFAPGDSIFLYDGGLYFRARADGQDFFIAKDEILKHSDSLVVYQSLRLTAASQTAGLSETATAKAPRQRCTQITKNGTRCRRMAVAGSDKCWQHKK
jgi:hypothetical protein